MFKRREVTLRRALLAAAEFYGTLRRDQGAPRPGRSRHADGAGARAASRRMSHARVNVGLRRPEVADREARTTQLSSRARVHVIDCEHRFPALIGDNSFQSGPPEIVLGKGQKMLSCGSGGPLT